MKKIDKFYDHLIGCEVTATNGDMGYVVSLGDLIDNGGKQEFFRVVTSQKNGIHVSRDVFWKPEYDRHERKWWADTYTGYLGYGRGLNRNSKVFIGFTF